MSPEEIRKIFDDDIAAIAGGLGVEVPKAVYRYAPHECWKCHRKILVYAWPPNRELFSKKEPPENKPATIQWRPTGMSDTYYWANTCPHCDRVQGDFFVHAEPNSPLFGLGEIENNPESFERDLLRLAEYYVTQSRTDAR